VSSFSKKILQWFDQYGRHDLPWQQQTTPYRVWVSEIMLQQTQVKTVIPYYERFMNSFPTIEALASASQEAVLSHWAGLGYYARGRNLHKSAQYITEHYQGVFPAKFEDVVALSGIGRSTAGAILSIALNQRMPILDGNVKRVLSRYFALEGWAGERKNEQVLWQKADDLTPKKRFKDYTQAIMDLGATVCTRSKPRCQICPVNQTCLARQTDQVQSLPTPKPKKIKPIKQTYCLIFQNTQGQVFLQQRPQKGIWGGLWSFPEFDSRQACLEQIKMGESQANITQSLVEWDSFRHTFSHYHLEIFPMVVKSVQNQPIQWEGQWVCRQSICMDKVTLGLPAPMTKLIKMMESQNV